MGRVDLDNTDHRLLKSGDYMPGAHVPGTHSSYCGGGFRPERSSRMSQAPRGSFRNQPSYRGSYSSYREQPAGTMSYRQSRVTGYPDGRETARVTARTSHYTNTIRRASGLPTVMGSSYRESLRPPMY